MLSTFVLGSATTYGLYRGYQMISVLPQRPNFNEFLRHEDVRSSILTVEAYLKKTKGKEQLRNQLKLVKRLLHDIDDLQKWRQKKYHRYFAYTGENTLIDRFREEWSIFKVRIRVISGLNYLDYIG